MKNLFRFSLLVPMIVISMISAGQAREDDKILEPKTISGTLTSATGWYKSKQSGKWISHTNYIGDETATEMNSASFRWMRIASFEYSGVTYFVWYWQQHEKIGDTETDNISYDIMNAAQYAKLLRAMDNGGRAAVPVHKHFFMEPPLNDASLMNDISLNHIKELGTGDAFLTDSVIVDCQTIAGQKIVRFDPMGVRILGAYFETDLAVLRSIQLPVTAEEVKAADPTGIWSKIELPNAGKVMNWQTSDTLYGSKCFIKGDIRRPAKFDWAVISSFTVDGRKMYCSYQVSTEDDGTKAGYFIIITNPQLYKVMKSNVLSRDGDGQMGSPLDSGWKLSSNSLIQDIEWQLTRKSPNGEECMMARVSKTKTKFFLTAMFCRISDFGTYDYLMCDTQEFMKLFTLP